MSVMPALAFADVSRMFGHGTNIITALDSIHISVQTGMICGLIGPDGAGKTTLMRLATGLLKPDSGKLQVLGMDITRSALQIQSAVGYMPQRFGLYEDLTVQENLDMYADLHGVSLEQRQIRYQQLMHMTALAPFTRRLAGQLSGGMKQKLGLACTLVRTPQLLLLDEPTAGVDPLSRRELWFIIKTLVQQEGLTVLLSTAYLDEAERCNDIILLHEGQVLGQGSPKQFSEPMRGRTFHISSPVFGKRKLQYQLGHTQGIIDAVIDNEKVRIVTETVQTRKDLQHLIADGDYCIEAVEPKFEDAFIASLKPQAVAPSPLVTTGQSRQTTTDTVIAVKNVQKRFGDFYAVKGISFSVNRGEVFGLLGANGAGKSTTFRMLCGLLPASAGELSVAGRDLRRSAAHARSSLGYMAQRFSLYGNLTVMENLKFFASIYGLNRRRRKQWIAWALETFELLDYVNSSGDDLPLGFKQRLALSAALLHEPEILFLDEPTSGVDPLARREFWQRINTLAEVGVTVLVTTHFMAEADYCDRLVIMSEGELLAQGTPTELKAEFQNHDLPTPSMEDAFIGLLEDQARKRETGS